MENANKNADVSLHIRQKSPKQKGQKDPMLVGFYNKYGVFL